MIYDQPIELEFAKLVPHVKTPAYAHEGDAGLDLRCSEGVAIAPGEQRTVSTGLAVAIPEGYAGLVIPRSGLAARLGLTITNSPGLIDSGYRGEIKLILHHTGATTRDGIVFAPGERIAQLVIVPIPRVSLVERDSLSASERGADGLGSTGTE